MYNWVCVYMEKFPEKKWHYSGGKERKDIQSKIVWCFSSVEETRWAIKYSWDVKWLMSPPHFQTL